MWLLYCFCKKKRENNFQNKTKKEKKKNRRTRQISRTLPGTQHTHSHNATHGDPGTDEHYPLVAHPPEALVPVERSLFGFGN
jgi:hypothetical protein